MPTERFFSKRGLDAVVDTVRGMGARLCARRSAGVGWAVLIVVGSGFMGCGGDRTPSAEPSNPLAVSAASYDFSRNRALLERLVESPHGYFRFINIPFSQEVCRRFGTAVEGTPLFNLHGDAHLEQYAITDLGRGLTDFDDSSTGPAVIDLLRLGVSLELLCRDFDCGDTGALYRRFLAGYDEALQDPELEAPEPRAVGRVRAGFGSDRDAYFEWVDSLMEALPESESQDLVSAMEPYVEVMLEQRPGESRRLYEWVDGGYLRAGVGSALDLKYLVRTRGVSDDPHDDLVLEVKQVRELDEIECISVSRGSDPFRVLLGQSRIAYEPYGHLGYIRLRGKTFWIHAWVENYRELELGETLSSPEELAEVVYDIGVQLGRGHPNQIGEPLGRQLRREQLRILRRDRERMVTAVRELTALTVAAWDGFRTEVSRDS